ncbi:alpha/beta fold hydrolase [Ostreiculturibacter nitratireducens]|uniref:alpha/beta fold hydrolase n=1 Tax=Ostreiculturibacter nitratireducens TaxID=3075226 RepID=UPI0031B592B7
MIYSFSDNKLDLKRHVLTRKGENIPVEPQVFDILHVLAKNAGSLVTKDQLIEAVWEGRIVSEATISARINAARTAVGDNGRDQRIIRTVPRRGFEMVAEVSIQEDAGPQALPELRQTIRYAASADGTNIAWSSAGEGPPLLYAWHHLSHLEKDWASGLLRRGLTALAERHRLIRYDIRGSGLSDPINREDGLDEHVDDMIAVADAAGLDRFPVVATLQAAAVAIRLAARWPHRVSRLVLHNGYARGRATRENAPEASDNDPFIALLKSGGWGDPDNGFMRAWATMVLPMASFDETTELIQLIAHACSTEDALLQRNLIDKLDVLDDLPKVRAPTLVIHTRMCTIHPAAEGRRVAAGIPGAEFLEVDSSNTFLISSDLAFDRVFGATLEFLDRDEPT